LIEEIFEGFARKPISKRRLKPKAKKPRSRRIRGSTNDRTVAARFVSFSFSFRFVFSLSRVLG